MFSVHRVTKKSEIQRLFALRYQVYCQERMFLDPRDYPNGLETDEYDATAIHLGAYGPDDHLIGSLRMVRSTEMRFPIFDHCEVTDLPKDASSLEFIEISRLLISKRKRAAIRSPDAKTPLHPETLRKDFADFGISDLLGELIRVLLVHSKQRGIKYWFAAMEPSLIRLLQLNHFNFHPIGPMADYYGQVMPCIASMIEIEKQMMTNNKDFYIQFAKHLMDPATSTLGDETMWPPPGFALP
ncbi:MAG: PEP-CTERM/exosortase system-associated acyltransferase [Undibacterium sp.]|jgi:N-acyl amino acid synthase of PEP-CTERM/exosortase system|nr:PEP-CTERM/exosortase system-associated acyltransferase [Undibacterium sp.]MDO8702060.1 PEP-CTERM/exosortase system-associated acyltransferase [Undibacterium sp.]